MRRWAVPFRTEWSGNRVILGVDSDRRVRMLFRHCHKASDRIVLAGPWGTKDPDTVGLARDMAFDSDRALDSGKGSDLSSHSDCSDKPRLVGLVADIDSEDRGNIRGPRLVDWDSQDPWDRDFLAALGSGTGYSNRENFRRIAAAGFDRDHTVVESSLGRMDIPGKMDSLVPSGHPDWGTRFVDIYPFVHRKDWP